MNPTHEAALESAIAPHLLQSDRTPKHVPGSYSPPYPSYAARFDEDVSAIVMAYFGVQSGRPDDPHAALSIEQLRVAFAEPGGPASVDRARYVDASGYDTTIHIAYWDSVDRFQSWFTEYGEPWLDPHATVGSVGRFLELTTPKADRVETIFSADDRTEGVARIARSFSGQIEEHAYWGSMRDRLPRGQHDPLYPAGSASIEVNGPVRIVRLHKNACLIRSGQDYTDTGDRERDMYLQSVEPELRAGMDFLRDEGREIGCYDNRFMVILDDDDRPTARTVGVSWWRDLAALEDWAASHPTHVQIFGAAMRHLSSFGADARLRLYHEVIVPDTHEQEFIYVNCHDDTGLLRAVR